MKNAKTNARAKAQCKKKHMKNETMQGQKHDAKKNTHTTEKCKK